MRLTLMGWILVIMIFLKLIGILSWSWGITLFPLWVIITLAAFQTLADKVEQRKTK